MIITKNNEKLRITAANLRAYYRDGIVAKKPKDSAYSCGCQCVCSGPLQRRFDPSQ